MDEKRIIRLCQNGHNEYLGSLVSAYEKPLYRYCYHLCGNQADAKDLFQETWVKVMTRIGSYNEQYSFRGWLYTITTNEFRDRYRKKTRRKHMLMNFKDQKTKDIVIETVPSTNPSAEDIMESLEIRDRLRFEINRLKWHYKSVIILRYFEEISVMNIAGILEIPEGTVKSRLFQARKILAERMKQSEK